MNERFESIKKEVAEFRGKLEYENKIEAELIHERIEKDKDLLETLGVLELFEEIRDKGLVKSRLKTTEELSRRPIFFASREDKLDYIPARICRGVNCHNIGRSDIAEDDVLVHASLEFDDMIVGSSRCYSVVRIAVVGEGLSLVSYNQETYEQEYTPIAEGKLAEAVVEGIKNPLKFA